MHRSAVRLLHNVPSAFRRRSASWKRTQVPLSISLPRRALFLPNHIIIYKFISTSLAHLHFSLIWQDSTKIGLKVMRMLGCVRDSDGAIEEPMAEFCDDSHENSVVYAKVNFLTSLAKASLLCIELPSLCYFTYLRLSFFLSFLPFPPFLC